MELSQNEPITDSKDDILGRADLVDHLEKLINNSPKNNSNVIGICGRWGCGKTSIINLLKRRFNENSNVIFVDFNPWIYSGQSDLTQQFFSVFISKINSKKKIYKTSKRLKKYTDDAAKQVGPAVKKISHILYPIVEDHKIIKLIKTYYDMISSPEEGKSLNEIKESISNMLIHSDYRFVFIIDDLDRLDVVEIRQMVKLVRSIADFSNVLYILAYDEDIVSNALNCDSYKGIDYIQKIVQLPIYVPDINEKTLYDCLMDKLDIIRDPEDNVPKSYVSSIVDHCIMPYISNIREVNILVDRFSVKYQISKGNTCYVDLLALTLLEMKDKKVYSWLYKNRYELCDRRAVISMPGDLKSKVRPINNYRNDYMSSEYEEFLRFLYPSFNDEYGVYGSMQVEGVDHRISSSKYVRNYFVLTPSSIPLPVSRVKYLVNEADIEEIKKEIVRFHHSAESVGYLMDEIIPELSGADNGRKKLFSDLMLFDDALIDSEYLKSIPLGIYRSPEIIEMYVYSSGHNCNLYLTEKIPHNIMSMPFFINVLLSLRDQLPRRSGKVPLMSEEEIEAISNKIISEIRDKYVLYSDALDSDKFYFMLEIVNNRDNELAKKIVDNFVKTSADAKKFVLNFCKNASFEYAETYLSLLDDVFRNDSSLLGEITTESNRLRIKKIMDNSK